MASLIRTTNWIRALADVDMMAIEDVVANVCKKRCEGIESFALFDGGAHKGYHTMRMMDLPGCDVVYAVEADPTMVHSLQSILEEKSNRRGDRLLCRGRRSSFVIVAKALQNDPSVTEITWKSSSSHTGRSSIVRDDATQKTIWERDESIVYRADLSVPATTIDKILEAERRPLPFLKLDLEGADIVSLIGAEETLRTKRPIVAFENSVHAPKVHGFTIAEVIKYLDALNYVAMNFVGERLDHSNWFGFFEAWLVPKDQADWLTDALREAVEVHANKVPNSLPSDKSQSAVADETAAASADVRPTDKDEVSTNLLMDEMSISERVARYGDLEIVQLNEKFLEATRTTGWRDMSADIARMFWLAPSRVKQPVEAEFPMDLWDERAKEYRARIRQVMRSLIREDLHFRQCDAVPDFTGFDERWMLDSGRLAWLIWLSARRGSHAKDEEAERVLWKAEAGPYRDYVRSVLRDIRQMGIVFAEDGSA